MPKSKLKPSEWILNRQAKLLDQHWNTAKFDWKQRQLKLDCRFQAILDYLDQLEDDQKYVRLASCDNTCMATPCPRHLATDGDYII